MALACDVLVIGSGTAASNVALPCARAGLAVAVVDARAFGGTCARRGCQPKKILVAAAEVVARAADLAGRGIAAPPALAWDELMEAKRAFTAAVPASTEETFRRAGITPLHGRARFVGPTTVRVAGRDGGDVAAGAIVVATGARPAPLDFPGADLLTSSEEFLELDALPGRVACVGGGYISLEFAHVAARAGARVTVLHRGPRILENFDPDLVRTLTEASRAAGIDVRTGSEVAAVVRAGGGLRVVGDRDRALCDADLVLHGAGRVPDLEELDLPAAGIAGGPGGVTVGPGLRSTTNPAVFAVGDAVDRPLRLAPTADHEGAVAAANIIAGRIVREVDEDATPSVVFTQPPLAAVGMTAAEAEAAGDAVRVRRGDMSGWPSARRLGQRFAGFKVMVERTSGRILGAHVLADGAGDIVNVFALAIRANLTAADLRGVLWAYPTATSDVKRMVPDPDGT